MKNSLSISDVVSKNGIFDDGDWIESKDQNPEGSVRLVQLADIGDGYFVNKSKRYMTKERAQELKCTFLEKGDILVARMPDPIGRACIFPGDDMESVTVVDVCVIRPNSSEINNEYLKYLFNGLPFRRQIGRFVTGTTRKRISRKNLDKIKFNLPMVDKQSVISTQLKMVDESLSKRRKVKSNYNNFLESLFVEIFREKLNDIKSHQKFENLLDKIENGWSPVVCQKQPTKDAEYGVLKLSAVSYGVYNPAENKAIIEGVEPKLSCEVQKGDFLFARKNTYELVGASVYVQDTPPKMMLPDIIFRLKIKDESELNPIYLWGLFNNTFFREKIRKLASGSAGSMPNISKQRLFGLEIPVPCIKKQKKYADIYLKVRDLQKKNRNQEIEIENLQDSLSAKYFN